MIVRAEEDIQRDIAVRDRAEKAPHYAKNSSESAMGSMYFRRGGMVLFDKKEGFQRQIHNIENTPFRTKFERDLADFRGHAGLGCISRTAPPAAARALPSGTCTPS